MAFSCIFNLFVVVLSFYTINLDNIKLYLSIIVLKALRTEQRIPAITDSYSRDHRLGGAKSALNKQIPHPARGRNPFLTATFYSGDGLLINVNLAFPQTFFFLSFFPSHSTTPSEARAWELACEQALPILGERSALEKRRKKPHRTPYACGQ